MTTPSPWKDDDLVYVDTDKRSVIGKVEFGKNGEAKPLQIPDDPVVIEKLRLRGRTSRKKRFYPWGTYRCIRKLYKIDGGLQEPERRITFEEAVQKSTKEPFWD